MFPMLKDFSGYNSCWMPVVITLQQVPDNIEWTSTLPVQRRAFLLWLLLQGASKDDLQQVINTCSKNLGCKLTMCRTSEQKVAILPYKGNKHYFILYSGNKTEENPLTRTEIMDSKPLPRMSKCAGYNLLRQKVQIPASNTTFPTGY